MRCLFFHISFSIALNLNKEHFQQHSQTPDHKGMIERAASLTGRALSKNSNKEIGGRGGFCRDPTTFMFNDKSHNKFGNPIFYSSDVLDVFSQL